MLFFITFFYKHSTDLSGENSNWFSASSLYSLQSLSYKLNTGCRLTPAFQTEGRTRKTELGGTLHQKPQTQKTKSKKEMKKKKRERGKGKNTHM